MDLTPNRSILQDKTNLISEPTHIKQSGKGLRTPVEKVSEVLSPTKLEKSVSKQTISSDSCSFNSALGSKEVESDTDATATADYDSAGENEFVLAPDSTEQAESLNLTLLANTLDGLHIATPQSDTHSPHDCSLFAVKFTKGEFPSQEELSSETADSSIVDSEQENDASLSGILNLSNASVEEITIAGITPLEFIASVENFENRRLSAARHCAATRSPERAVSNDNNSTVNVIESQLSVENHLNDSSLRENSRSFSGIPNLSNISYEDITGITPFGFIASAENFENNQLSATNVIATDESPNIKTEFEKDLVEDRSQVVEDITDESSTIKTKLDEKDLVEDRSQVVEDITDESSTIKTKLDEKDLVEDRSQVIEDITDESSTTKPKLDEKDLVEDRSQVVEDITEESSTIKTKLDDKDLVEDRTQVIEDITDEYSTIKIKFDEKDLVEDKSQVKEDLTGATPIVSAENIQLSAHDNNVIDTSTLKTKLDEKYSIEDKSQLKESEVHSSFENSIPDVNPAPVVLQPPVNSDSVTSQLITDIKTFDLPKHEAVLCISAQESCEQVLSSPKQEFDIKLEAHSQATDINNSLLAACESLAPQETDSCKISPGRLCISDEIAISSSETVNKSADVSECSNLIDKINESSETDGKLTINLDHTIVLPTLVSSAKQESTTLEESLTNVKVRDTVNDVLDFLQTQSSLKTSQVEDSVATVGTQDPNVDTSNQETVGGSSLSDFENSEHPDLKNESPGNVSVTKELTVAITDDLTETVISDLLAKAESGSSSHHQNKVVTSSHRQDLLNGPSEETVSINNNLESECHEVTHTKLECLENISTVHKASPTSTCDQVLTAENNFSGTNSVQSPENVLNVQTSHLDASNNKLDYSSVQTLSEGSLSVEKVDTLNGPALLKEVIDEVCAETLPCVEETAGTLKNEVDEGSFKDKFNEVLPVDSKSPKITLEHEKTISENLKYSEICQETEKEAQNITPVCFKNLLEPLPKADQIKTTLETVNKDLPSVSSELNANIVESENHVDLSLINKPSQESTSLAKQDFVKENSELNASTSSLDESLPLLDAIDESFDIRSENKFENVDQGLKSSEKVNHPEQDKKIVSSKFCIANLNESVSHEPIKESSVILDNTKACFSELIVNCLNQSSLNGPDTVSCLNQASLNGPDTVSCLNQASLNGPDTVSCLNQASLNSPDTVSPTDDLKNNNFPVLRSEDTALKSSVENTSHISSNNTQKVEEAFHRIDVVTENVNKSFSRRLDYASVPQSIEVPAVDELKNKEPVISEKDILDEAFNKLSIEIRDNLLKENSPLKVEASKSPKNKFFVGSDYFTGDETLNLGNSPVAADEKQSFKDNNSEQFELKSACLSEVSKTVPTESSNPNSEDSEKNGNIEELNFDDSLTEQALNLSKEILNTEEDMSDNYTVEMDNRLCSPAKSGGTNLSSLESNGHGNHGVDVDLDKTFEKQSEPTFDIAANSSEAGPITAEEFSIPASAFQFDFDSLPCGARNTRLAGANLTRNSLYVKFDPIVGKILANPENSPVRLLPQTPGRLEESSLERTPMKNPTLDDKLISLTPCSTVDTGDANSSIPEQLDSSIDSVSSKTIENASLNKTDPDITQRVRNLSFEAESKQSSSSATPQANKLQTSRTTARGTVVSQEYYLKELEKLQDLMSKQEQGYQEELKRNTEKMEKLQVEVSTLKKEMHSQAKSLSQSNVVLAEYERTISQLLAQNEADKKQFEVLKEKLIQERDTVTIHLNNTEIAFNDVHQKYERSKTVIEEMKNIQDALKASNQEFEKSLRVQEEKYNKLRSHVAGQLEKANHEMDSMMRSHQAENDKLKAKLKQAEITIKSLENSNEHKSKENKELTQILDELIGKVGADGV